MSAYMLETMLYTVVVGPVTVEMNGKSSEMTACWDWVTSKQVWVAWYGTSPIIPIIQLSV